MAAEKNFENRVKKFLEDEGCWFVKFFANAYTKSGIPDLLVCCNGYFVGVELKAPKGRPSELQKRSRNQIHDAKGFGVILYPEDFEALKLMIRFLNRDDLAAARAMEELINERTGEETEVLPF